ncbi:MAG: response regulator [Pseudomonadota bacterium]
MTDSGASGSRGDWDVSELVERSPYPMYVRDRDVLLFVNAAFAELLAYESVAALMAVGQFSALVHPDQRDAFRLRLGAGSVGPGSKATLIGKDGREVIVDVVARFIVWGGRKVRYGILTDQTQRVQAETALKESEERYRRLVFDSRNGVSVEAHGRIVFANLALAKLLGFGSPQQMLGMPTWFNVAPDRMTTTGAGPREMTLTRPDDKCITLLVSTHVIRWEGEEALQREVVDITRIRRVEAEREALQRQLIQNQKMQAIGELTGGLAHDLNNMLSPMLGFAELAERSARRDGNTQMLGFVSQIQTAGKRARDLVGQILVFARGSDAQLETLALAPEFERSLEFVRAMLPSSVELRWDVEDSGASVLMNPNQFDQVVMNLCLNAAQAVNGQGRVRAKASREAVEGHCSSCGQAFSGEFAVVSVEDDGAGRDADEILRMFEPFYSTRDVGEGSGMGLSVVHGIAHQTGGHIVALRSDLGGLKMQLCLPLIDRIRSFTPADLLPHEQVRPSLDEPVKAEQLDDGPPVARAAIGSVWVLDDEPAILELFRAVLVREGARVQTFSNVSEVLECFYADPLAADLILTDQTLPGSSGIDLIESVREIREDLPIILCSGFEEPPRVAEYLADPRFTFLRKPVDLDVLSAAVRRLVEARHARGKTAL